MVVEITPEKGGTTMKLKKLLALTLAGAVLTVSLTACTPLDAAELLYDWLFGGGSSSASRGNGTGLVRSETLEESIIRWLELANANREKDEAEQMLQEAAKRFDPGSWYNEKGELNGTAKAVLDTIVQDKLTANRLPMYTFVDVWEVQSSPTDFPPSESRQLYVDSYYSSGSGAISDEPTHSSYMRSYSVVKDWMKRTYTSNVYAGVFQKNGKTYAAMVIIW